MLNRQTSLRSQILPLSMIQQTELRTDYEEIDILHNPARTEMIINPLFRHPIQTQLYRCPQDQHEQEAEQVAQNVINPPTIYRGGIDNLQPAQSHIQGRIKNSSSQAINPYTTAQIYDLIQTTGSSLPLNMQQEMESRFGNEDFSEVQIHTDSNSIAVADSMGAEAFTLGHHIVGDLRNPVTLAHELQHIRQQHQAPSQDSNIIQCKLKGTAATLQTEAGNPSLNAKAKRILSLGTAQTPYARILEAILQYESMEDEVQRGAQPLSGVQCVQMLKDILRLIQEWFRVHTHGPTDQLKTNEARRSEALATARRTVESEISTVSLLGHPDVPRLNQETIAAYDQDPTDLQFSHGNDPSHSNHSSQSIPPLDTLALTQPPPSDQALTQATRQDISRSPQPRPPEINTELPPPTYSTVMASPLSFRPTPSQHARTSNPSSHEITAEPPPPSYSGINFPDRSHNPALWNILMPLWSQVSHLKYIVGHAPSAGYASGRIHSQQYRQFYIVVQDQIQHIQQALCETYLAENNRQINQKLILASEIVGRSLTLIKDSFNPHTHYSYQQILAVFEQLIEALSSHRQTQHSSHPTYSLPTQNSQFTML